MAKSHPNRRSLPKLRVFKKLLINENKLKTQ